MKQLAQDVKEVRPETLGGQQINPGKLSELERLMRTRSAPPPADSGRKIDPKADLFKYSVQKGDSLLRLIPSSGAQGHEVHKSHRGCNPGVNWARLQIGRKLSACPKD